MQTRYVVDTNIMTAWLLNPTCTSARIIRSGALELFTPYKAIDELWEHRAEWSRKQPAVRLAEFVDAIGYYISVVYVNQDSTEMRDAVRVMDKIDPDDAEFLAAALIEHAEIWSRDNDFTKQSLVPSVTTEDLVRRASTNAELWMAINTENWTS